VLYLLSPRQSEEQGLSRHHPNLPRSCNNFQWDSDSSSDASSLPPTPTEACFQTSGPPRTVVHIDIVPDDTPTTPVRSLQQEVIGEEQQWPSIGDGIVRASQHPRPIHCIDPTITLLSHSPISARSVFQVISSGMTVFSETTPLAPAGPAPEAASGALLYKTTLVPGFWDKISNSSGEDHYLILLAISNSQCRPNAVCYHAGRHSRWTHIVIHDVLGGVQVQLLSIWRL
jgi:transcriptional enhancer factor